MRPMKDSGVEWIGEIPECWEIKRIKFLPDTKISNSYVDGDWIESPDITDSGIRYLTTGNVGDGKYKKQGNGYISQETFNRLNCKYAYPGDLVISRLNEPFGRSCILPDDFSEYVLAVDNVILRSAEEKRFLCYVTQCGGYQYAVGDEAKGTTMKRISRTNLGNIAMPIPSKEEQQRIADYLDSKCAAIDSIIEKQQKIIEKLKEYKLSIITEAVTKGLNPDVEMKDSGVEVIGKIPSSWKVCRLRNIAKLQNGISKGSEFFGTGFPFVSYGDVYKNYVLPQKVTGLVQSTEDEQKEYSVEAGDIFFTRTSETIEEVGFSSVCESTIPCATFAGFVIRVRPFTDELLTDFAKYFFRSDHQRDYLVKEMNLVTRASLSQDLLKSMPVLVPPKEEQERIFNYLDSKCEAIDTSIANKGQIIVKLTEYKKSLIYEVVTGKKEV